MKINKIKLLLALFLMQIFLVNCFTDDTNWKELEKTFLTKRPRLGPAWVADLKGTTLAEKLFLRTFQGMINKKRARLYIVNSESQEFGEAEQFWIDEYERRGWVRVKKRDMNIDDVIEKFAHEVEGFIRATEAEPWTIHTAAVTAMLKNAVVAPDAVADKLLNSGWLELDNMCNKWPDGVSAYESIVNQYKDQLAYPGIALLRSRENLWDFVMQQEIMPLFSRPTHETWGAVASIIDSYPPNKILYGYVSDDTFEEAIAVQRLSSSGKFLVPTHEVSNLSFHAAVLGKYTPGALSKKTQKNVEKCDSSQVNIAIAMSDGDNLQVPILQYPQSVYWNTPERGSLPFGWGTGMGLPVVAPGIWEFYRDTIRPNDEIVSLMGFSYANAYQMPEASRALYFKDSFYAMRDTGVHTLWTLDSSLTITDDPLWDSIDESPSYDALHGVLVGYGPSIDKAFTRSTGLPVLISQNGYGDNAQEVKTRIEKIMSLDPTDRSPVNFLMVTNWDTTAESYYQILSPLVEQGVRFLTPGEALACMPEIEGVAKTHPKIEPSAGECRPSGTLHRFRSDTLSAPALAEINKPLNIPITTMVEATESIIPGGTINYSAVVKVNTNSFIYDFHINRVIPVMIDYGLEPFFLEYAWTKLEASNIMISIPLPEGTSSGDIISIDSSDIDASVKFEGDNLLITLDHFLADLRLLYDNPPEPEITIHWTVNHNNNKNLSSIELKPEADLFDFILTIGVAEEEGPMVGAVKGLMKCAGDGNLAETQIVQE